MTDFPILILAGLLILPGLALLGIRATVAKPGAAALAAAAWVGIPWCMAALMAQIMSGMAHSNMRHHSNVATFMTLAWLLLTSVATIWMYTDKKMQGSKALNGDETAQERTAAALDPSSPWFLLRYSAYRLGGFAHLACLLLFAYHLAAFLSRQPQRGE